MKICGKCKEEKDLKEFYKDKTKKDGLYNSCKVCVSIYQGNNKEKIAKRMKDYRKNNKEKFIKYEKEYWKNNKEKKGKYNKEYLARFPWKRTLHEIKQRCGNPKHIGYHRYGGRGIKCLITSEELKQIWFRDKAYEMKKPSIDRIDNDGNYNLENCRYIELSENRKKSNK